MPQLILITGLNQFQRQAHIGQFLQSRVVQRSLPPDYLYLVPTQRKVNHTQDWLLKQKGEGWLPLVYTPSQLAEKLYFKLGGDKRPISEFTQRLLLYSLLTRTDTKWEFFTSEQLTPGLLKGMVKLMAQVKTYSRGDLLSAIRHYRSPADLQVKDSDLLRLFQDYQQSLTQKSLADAQDILSGVIQLVEEWPAQLRWRLNTLVIDGFYYFTPLEQEFIKALIKVFERVVVSIDCHNPSTDEDHPLLTHSVGTRYLDFWQALGANPEHTLGQVPPGQVPSLINPPAHDQGFLAISQRLFQQPTAAVPIPSSKLIIRCLLQRRDEVRAIARHIRQITSQHPDTRLDHIYVVFPRMETYAPLVQELFPSYGIPYEITKGYPLHSSPVTRAVLKLLAMKLNGCRREDWCALFASELVGYSASINPSQWTEFVNTLGLESVTTQQLLSRPPSGEQQLNMPLIDTLARRANLQGGADWRQDWLLPLVKAVRPGMEVGEQAEVYCQLYLLQQAWDEFDRLPPSLTIQQFIHGLLYLIRRFGIPQNIINKLEQIHTYAQRDKQIILRRQLKALDKLYSLLQRLVSALGLVGKGDAAFHLSDLHSLLLGYLATEEYHLTDHTEDRVQIVEPLELRGLYFEYLFWGGLVEEEFPRPEPRALFYPYTGRKRLFESLPKLDEDRYLFSYIFKNTHRQITLSYPSSDQGKPVLPSPFIEELRQVAAIDMAAPVPSPLSCYTCQELLCGIAVDWNKGSPPLVMLKALKELDTEAYFKALHILEVEGLRQSSAGFSPYEGLLASSANLASLKQLNPGACYPVTRLEDYALCPLGYFFKYIVQLKPVEEIVGEFQPEDRGRLLHKILEDFYRQRIEEYCHCPERIKVTGANLEEASRQMLYCAQRVLSKPHTKYHNLFWQNEKQGWLAGLEPGDDQQPPGLLRALLEYEARSSDRLIPRYLEFRFGQAGAAPALCLDNLSLEGRVDRIDLALDEGLSVVYDYKFGTAPAGLLIHRGLSFQLPVYMLAVAEYLKSKGYQIVAGGYYQLKSTHQMGKSNYFGQEEIRAQYPRELGGSKILASRQRSYGFLPVDEFGQQLEQVKARLSHIHQLITRGRFHPPLGSEDALPCRFCDYAHICRLDTIRLAKIYSSLSDQEHYKPLMEG